jgi:membrane protein implicated in regulation of membrane protease activity
MALTEDAAAKIILIRSVEECDRNFFSDSLLVDSFAVARNMAPGLGWVKARGQFLFDHLSSAYQSVIHLATLPTPLTLPVCLIALALGFATNLLGPAEKIHVVRNPVLLLVAWNLFVYLVLFLVLLAKPRRHLTVSSSSNPAGAKQPTNNPQGAVTEAKINISRLAQFFMPGFWHFFHRVALGVGEKQKLADVVSRFSVNWYAVAAPLVVARWEVMLHLGALFLATGAVAGMYFQGLFQGYQAIWSSTFITGEPSVIAFVHALFGPSLLVSDLLGLGLASEIDVARLLSPQGDKAAAWIHLFAITVLLIIVIPRAALAAWQWRNIKRRRSDIGLRLDPYYGEIIEAPVRALIEKEVANGAKQFSEDVASFVGRKLYEERIVPRLRQFREEGGKVSELKSEIQSVSEAFALQIESYVAETRLSEFQRTLSQRVGEILKSLGTDFVVIKEPQAVLGGMRIATGGSTDMGISQQFTSAIGLSVGTSIALAIATVSGGLGKYLGVAIVATLLHTTGPVGFLIGLIGGAVVAAGAWWLGKEKVAAAVEALDLPAVVVRTALWESRFQRLTDDGRKKCEDSVRAEVDERLKALQPIITTEILSRVRSLWQG